MYSRATLLLLAALPALAGMAVGEVVSVTSAGPTFAAQQHTLVIAPLGHAATLDCIVHRLADKSVSWVRSRDLQILSHAGVVFTADERVAARAGVDGRHWLRIEQLRVGDSGRYECQVNTEPKMSLFFNLTVVDEPVPRVVMSAPGVVQARLGDSATLACSARYSPAPRALPLAPLDVRWSRAGAPLDLHSARGGVSLDTERWPARADSRLTLADLSAADAGEYLCTAGGQAQVLLLQVLPSDDELGAEAMQRDEGAAGAATTSHSLTPALSLSLALVMTSLVRR